MRVVIIGAGNVATVLGRRIKKAGHEILQVISRSQESAKVLAKELGCNASNNFADIDKTGELFLVAMSDAALNELKEKINVGDKLVVHTAGSVCKDVLKDVSVNYGTLYPLQSLRKENPDESIVIPILIDAINDYSIRIINDFAISISPIVSYTQDDQRLKLHVGAVLTSNFANHLYCLALEFCEKEKVDFKLLQPLIEETAARLKSQSPCDMQTGPAARKDVLTLDKHLRLLTAHPKLRTLYLRMTDSIMNP
ncbi:MAG TPA: DUF2520 domain-containing protein [Ferruginibacter sp.]|nr:DUF2520 domain-containing protein [Ferruginibacter sp.]